MQRKGSTPSSNLHSQMASCDVVRSDPPRIRHQATDISQTEMDGNRSELDGRPPGRLRQRWGSLWPAHSSGLGLGLAGGRALLDEEQVGGREDEKLQREGGSWWTFSNASPTPNSKNGPSEQKWASLAGLKWASLAGLCLENSAKIMHTTECHLFEKSSDLDRALLLDEGPPAQAHTSVPLWPVLWFVTRWTVQQNFTTGTSTFGACGERGRGTPLLVILETPRVPHHAPVAPGCAVKPQR